MKTMTLTKCYNALPANRSACQQYGPGTVDLPDEVYAVIFPQQEAENVRLAAEQALHEQRQQDIADEMAAKQEARSHQQALTELAQAHRATQEGTVTP